MNNKIKILYLEDDIPLANLVKRKLERKNYLVQITEDGLDCLKRLQKQKFDLLIVDFVTPKLNGLEVLQRLHQDKKLPLSIMVSGGNDIQVAITAMNLGCADYVIKEVGNYFDLLLVSIENVLEKDSLEKAKLLAEKNLQRAQQLAKIGSWEYYPGDKLAHWSEQEFDNFGYNPDVDQPSFDLYISRVHPEDRHLILQQDISHIRENQPFEYDYRLLLDNNEIRYIHARTEIDENDDNDIIRVFGISQDVTERTKAEQKLREAATVFETTSEAIFICDKDNQIISINQAFTTITGFTEDVSIGKSPDFLGTSYHNDDLFQEIWVALTEEGNWSGEVSNQHRDGHNYPVWQSITAIKDENNQILQYVSIFSDISKRKENEELIRFQANYDNLTELPNRYLFQDRLANALKQAQRNEARVALLILDLDRFKLINDTLGHKAGDLLLKETARRLELSIRDSDTVARLGGDEFTIILPQVENSSDVELIAEKIFESFRKPVFIEGNEVFISSSIGIAVFPEDGDDVEALQKNADSAMYSAKQEGSNRYHYYTPQIQEVAERRLKIINLLRAAIEKREFTLCYQPIINLGSGEITCVEALLKWKQPELGLIQPSEFIPLAEETGLIKPIGTWVMNEVAITLRRWQRMGLKPIQISVNISAAQFSVASCCEEWFEILENNYVSAKHIIIEITESVLMSNAENSLAMITKLRNMGMQISLDDFGTGYSSLSYLKKFPVDILKIDRSFIMDIPTDILLVETILTLAEKMGITVIAEGVETEEQLDFLKGQKCQYVQGFYFSKPLSLAELEQFRIQFQISTV